MRFQYTHLYLNGDYRGVYMFCERIEPNSCGMNIDESEGFLVEMDIYSTEENSFQVGDKTYAVQSDYASQDQPDQIYRYIDEVDTAIMLEDEEAIRELLDIPSWVDAYLVEEFMMNSDVGYSSFYLYCPDGVSKLFAGPLWDFDLSSGDNSDTYRGLYEGFYASEIKGTVSDHQWFGWLMGMEWFSDAVRERWQEISPIVAGVICQLEVRTPGAAASAPGASPDLRFLRPPPGCGLFLAFLFSVKGRPTPSFPSRVDASQKPDIIK